MAFEHVREVRLKHACLDARLAGRPALLRQGARSEAGIR